MTNYFRKKEEYEKDVKKYYREKTNLRLKYGALASIAVSIILLLTMALGFIDFSNTRLLLFMRGCAGLFALIFVVLVGALVYRVNSAYSKEKYQRK